VHELRGEALGTVWLVKWLEPALSDEAAIEAATTQALAEVDRAMSTWRDDSDLSRIRATTGPVVVAEETALVVEAALVLARDTGGAFDPTVQPLMELWGFHGTERETLPTDEEIEAARAQVDFLRVRVGRDDQGRPTVDGGGTALDLSAIAKGHAVDRVSVALSDLGVPDHMVEVGGEVRAHGRGPSGALWKVGVDLPQEGWAPGALLADVVVVTNAAVATSGNYRQTRRIGDTIVHHTMDPRTGRPATSRVASATVIAADCRTADGFATALMVLDPDAGLRLVEDRPDLEALLLVPEGESFVRRPSTGMSRHLVTETAYATPASSD
jgi:thiamine biosynthesis lipoprotein